MAHIAWSWHGHARRCKKLLALKISFRFVQLGQLRSQCAHPFNCRYRYKCASSLVESERAFSSTIDSRATFLFLPGVDGHGDHHP